MPPELKIDIPHSARVYDYLLGGKDNFEADREVGDKIKEASPGIVTSMRANRRFVAKVAWWLAAEAGVRQFLDVGTGLPTHPNLHEVVQEVNPRCRVVYVDNDPLVLVHARALLSSMPEGSCDYLDADLRSPDAIMSSEAVRLGLELSRPVAVSVIAVLQHIADDDEVRAILAALMRPLASGSFLALSVVTEDNDPQGGAKINKSYNQSGVTLVARNRKTVESFFDGLTLEDPGIVPVHQWHPSGEDLTVDDNDVYMLGGVARKP